MKSLRTLRIHTLFVAAFACLSILFASCGDSSYNGPTGGDDDNTGGSTSVSANNKNANVATSADRAVLRIEFPALRKKGNQQIIVHRVSDNTTYDKDRINFCTEWDCDLKSQRWSCYQLHKGFTGSYSRVVNSYPEDPAIASANRYDDMIYHSGFEHGHICPSADRQYSHDANYQTFFMSNMQPQYHEFNGYDKKDGNKKGLWLRMEQQLQKWAKSLGTNDTIFVCKGGTIDDEKNIIKRINGKLIVPKYFFMAILRKTQFGYAAMAFWSDQTSAYRENETLLSHAISIDELESRTGIDFFCNLPDDIENKVEKTFNKASWDGLK